MSEKESLVVVYKGMVDPDKDGQIENLVGVKSHSSGFSFCEAERDLLFDVENAELPNILDRLKSLDVKASVQF